MINTNIIIKKIYINISMSLQTNKFKKKGFVKIKKFFSKKLI